MWVYRVSRDGSVSREVRRVEVMIGDKLAPIMTSRALTAQAQLGSPYWMPRPFVPR